MIQENSSLLPYNTFGIDVKAKRLGVFNDIESLRDLLSQKNEDELLIIGGGSNLLLTKDFDGFVLKNEIKGIHVISENEDEVIVSAGAGENWHAFVMHCIHNNWAGIENLSLIPGSVGASPMQNIGAYGVEIKDVFDHLKAFHIATGEIHNFDAPSCAFGYRESVFKRKLKGQYIICEVAFKLNKKPNKNTSYGAIEQELAKKGITDPNIREISNAVIAIRESKLPNPALLGNAGSFFKNPIITAALAQELIEKFPDLPNYPSTEGMRKLAAGWLIEKAGWKGFRRSNHGVHKDQALVLVNYGGSTGNEVFQLSSDIIASVEDMFGVSLEREVNIL